MTTTTQLSLKRRTGDQDSSNVTLAVLETRLPKWCEEGDARATNSGTQRGQMARLSQRWGRPAALSSHRVCCGGRQKVRRVLTGALFVDDNDGHISEDVNSTRPSEIPDIFLSIHLSAARTKLQYTPSDSSWIFINEWARTATVSTQETNCTNDANTEVLEIQRQVDSLGSRQKDRRRESGDRSEGRRDGLTRVVNSNQRKHRIPKTLGFHCPDVNRS